MNENPAVFLCVSYHQNTGGDSKYGVLSVLTRLPQVSNQQHRISTPACSLLDILPSYRYIDQLIALASAKGLSRPAVGTQPHNKVEAVVLVCCCRWAPLQVVPLVPKIAPLRRVTAPRNSRTDRQKSERAFGAWERWTTEAPAQARTNATIGIGRFPTCPAART